MPYVCIVSLRVFASISTWALVYWRHVSLMNPRLKKSLSILEHSQQRFRVKHYKALYKCCVLLLLYITFLLSIYLLILFYTLYQFGFQMHKLNPSHTLPGMSDPSTIIVDGVGSTTTTTVSGKKCFGLFNYLVAFIHQLSLIHYPFIVLLFFFVIISIILVYKFMIILHIQSVIISLYKLFV